MAISPVPSNFQSLSSASTSQFQHFLNFYPKTRSLNSFRGQKLGIYSCRQTVQIDNEAQQRINVGKKKRKPRPSFLEQIQSKWSLKTPSVRENFPWEVEKRNGMNLEFQPQEPESFEDISSEKDESVSEPVSHHTGNRSILAPLVHGYVPRKKVTGSGILKELDRGDQLTGFYEHWRKEEAFGSVEGSGSEDLEKETILDGKAEEKCSKFDEIENGLPGKDEILQAESNDVSVVESSLANYEDASSEKSSTDKNDRPRLPWEGRNEEKFVGMKSMNSNTKLAEVMIPEPELKRLRNVSLRMYERIKVSAAGVTQELVDVIHEKWKDEEVVKLKFRGGPAMNMKRTHEFLEHRTGGLVIWRSGSLIVLYRGLTYKLDCVKSYTKHVQADVKPSELSNSKYINSISKEEQAEFSELDRLLSELGPRYTDWSAREPIPVDADLLPPVPGYKTPFRLLPYGVRETLRDEEMTNLRRTARVMAPHFALGRSRGLHGLAKAMVKLWEKCAVAKIALKRGVPNTNNERIAEDLKTLTGGTVLSRNKEFIVVYRGNDFLPPSVASALVEAERCAGLRQDEEDQARDRALTLINLKAKKSAQPLVAGTLAETLAATMRWGSQTNGAEVEKMKRDAAVAQHASLVKSVQLKLTNAKSKLGMAEKALRKVLANQEPENLPTDLETLTDEERFTLRRIGLSMKPYLLLGRREIFGGTIENMHLHWKYRELVKIVINRKSFPQVKHIAVALEAESGGVLLSVDKTARGYVIIVYRGKNYQRPLAMRPRNLLTKRQALARSVELQRRETLKRHIIKLEDRLEKMKQELEDMKSVNNNVEGVLDSGINSATVSVLDSGIDSATDSGLDSGINSATDYDGDRDM